ncbi:ParA family protein [Bifidobacterium pseudocatenulatum]|uniref:ParA family protein n=1 Tax=Bifidobacterium pseudocatenulatum TaxID=28026 RepID=UPI00321ABA78
MTTNTKTVAFVNLKGGVGKTTSAIGTAEALARLGHTVTVRDADPSGAATLWAHKALSAGRPLPFGVEVVNRFTVAAPAEEFLAENGLARCQETIPYKEAMRLAPDEGRFPSASGYGLIAKELSDAFNA